MSLAPTANRLAAPSLSDHQLVAAVRRGDDRAFEELYSRYRGRVGSYIQGKVGDHARSEDVAQEVFISALRRMRDTERPIAFKPWIYEIAKNACVDEFRRTRRTREVPLESEREPQLRMPPSITPDAAVESKQRLVDLRGAFSGLSESHHRIIVLRELEGLSYREIGSRMGMSKPTVESTLFRARQRLGEEYGELVSGRRCEQIRALIADGGEPPLRRLGVRARRQLARHLAHCQLCRREARLAEIPEEFFRAPGLAGKLAALLPFGWLGRLHWRRAQAQGNALASSASQPAIQLQGLVQYAAAGGAGSGAGRAAAAAAALVIGGAGGGLVTLATQQPSQHRPAVRQAPANTAAPTGGFRLAAARLSDQIRPAPAAHRKASTDATHRQAPMTATTPVQHAAPPPSGPTNALAPVIRVLRSAGVPSDLGAQGQGGASAQKPPSDTQGSSLPSLQVPTLDKPSVPKISAMGYWRHRGVAQPGSAHRSGR